MRAYVDIGTEFNTALLYRSSTQGPNSGEDFRKKYLSRLDNNDAWQWKTSDVFVVLDFKNVEVLSPSFADEAFGYFTKYANNIDIFKRIIVNIKRIHEEIIKEEVNECWLNRN
jgi:epoxyqueuosine reductase QueG